MYLYMSAFTVMVTDAHLTPTVHYKHTAAISYGYLLEKGRMVLKPMCLKDQ